MTGQPARYFIFFTKPGDEDREVHLKVALTAVEAADFIRERSLTRAELGEDDIQEDLAWGLLDGGGMAIVIRGTEPEWDARLTVTIDGEVSSG